MISEEAFRGRADYVAFTGIYVIQSNTPRFLRMSCGVGDKIEMPVATLFSIGATISIWNVGLNEIVYNVGINIRPGEFATFIADGTATWIQLIRASTPTLGAITSLSAVVVGGQPTPTQTSEYSFSTATWTARTVSPRDRHFGAGFLQGDRWYYTGLYPADVTNGPVTNEFNLMLNSWRVMTNCPFNPVRATAAYTPRFGFVMSGDSSVAVAKYSQFAWTSMRSAPIPRPRSAAGRCRDLLYWMAGDPVPIGGLEYHPLLDVYVTVTAPGSTSRYNVSCFSENNRVFVCGGKTDPSTAYDLVDEYAPLTKTWTVKTVLSMGSRHTGATFQHSGYGYYCAGANGADAPQTNAARFANNAWTAIAAAPGVWGVANQGASR